jgi:DNA-binding IclR family transcriptional regulator
MVALASTATKGTAVLLCRAYRDQLMCIHQEMTYGPQDPVSFQVGRPMPLYRGSSSVIVLANLDRTRLLHLYERDHEVIRESGLGSTKEQYLATLKAVRRTGHLVSRGEVDRGRIGVAAGFVQKSLGITGSISLVLSETTSTEVDVSRAIVQVVAAAHEISAKLRAFEAASKPAEDMGPPAAIA